MRSGRTAAVAAAPRRAPSGTRPDDQPPPAASTPPRDDAPLDEIHHADEVRDEAVGRALVDFVRRVALEEPPVLQHRHAVGHDQRLLLVVRDHHEGDADLVLQALQLELHGAAELLVERGERLVEQEQARALHQRAGERHALLLAAGELVGAAVGELGRDASSARMASTRAAISARGSRSISSP